ncbi:hypothetical protein VOLCADRAFT_91483 [Volvox carteri f. nagariensis]|uniref:Secreted protein n=1 Tax=Volvox carteri f. nagariensis TaxID=3068 RepID=D8TX69_VOLCA|nr:uncharacterized protein VOLCADRAFT_91483 [Volvox carteri f. nagariensis]EFJ47855.1 hypothetical protein VOLCADRAFT_91483 [Volvox carteri f. nagariensis]|eukprot:XP_002950961.1 hypothetical protein VOLCADRAFT_91483 [Volvox carteri f. nagariensis]
MANFTFSCILKISVGCLLWCIAVMQHLTLECATCCLCMANVGTVAKLRTSSTNGNSTGGGTTLSCTVWFPGDWQSVSGNFVGQTALDSFVFYLLQFPPLALSLPDTYPDLNATLAEHCVISTRNHWVFTRNCARNWLHAPVIHLQHRVISTRNSGVVARKCSPVSLCSNYGTRNVLRTRNFCQITGGLTQIYG